MPSSIIERLDSDVRLPFDEDALRSGEPAELTDYLRRLVKTLQELLEKITIVANSGVDSNDGEYVYFGLKGSDGEYPNGVWRRGRSGDNLVDQVKIDGTWNTVHTRERPV